MTGELSGPMKRREREREYRVRTILDAAEHLFAQKGFLKTSVEQIADAAELSVGTVYFYFKNKEALLAALFDESLFLLRSILGEKFEAAPSPLAGMEMAGHAFFEEFCSQYTTKALVLFREAPAHGKKMEARRKKMSETIARDLSGAIERLGRESGARFPGPRSPMVFAQCILGVYEKLAFHFLTETLTPGEKADLARDAVEFTVGGMRQVAAPEKGHL
ncbi:MAG: helix-turn-helix transcriptional regulator [Desulfobacter sp.]|nr:MAG: helix-turn-helix transcriptional regulator [Desulfobacter sp.]